MEITKNQIQNVVAVKLCRSMFTIQTSKNVAGMEMLLFKVNVLHNQLQQLQQSRRQQQHLQQQPHQQPPHQLRRHQPRVHIQQHQQQHYRQQRLLGQRRYLRHQFMAKNK